MDRIKALIREPALLLDAFESAVVVAVALGLFNITGDQQRYIIGAFIAVLALAKGFTTKPFPVTVIPGLGRALLVLVGSFGLIHLNADQITLLVTFLGTLTSLVARAQITPRYDPVIAPAGAGAGPVVGNGEGGYGDVFTLFGVALIILGLLLILLLHHLVIGIVLAIVGVVLLVGSQARGRL